MMVWVVFSRGEASGRHNVWDGDAVRPVKERQQNVAADHLQLVSQDQCQAWWHQQYTAAQHTVCMLS